MVGSWSQTASLTTARTGHTATVIPDGRVLVAGGAGADGNALDSLELFNPETGTFAPAGILSTARTEHAAAVAGATKVLVAGGRSANAVSSTADVIDLDGGAVSTVVLTAARAGASATTLLDGTRRSWSLVARMERNDLATAEIIDPVAGVSSPTGAMAQARHGHQALLLDHNATVLIVGGTDRGVVVAGAEQFVPWSATFSATGSPASARLLATVSNVSARPGVALLAAGEESANPTEFYGFATLQTDADDYAPGTNVVVSGTGWQPGETVTLVLHEVGTGHPDRTYSALADESGRFVNTGFTPDQQHLGVRFYLSARGAASEAQATFTDGQPSTATLTPISANIAPGDDAVYTLTVDFAGNGGVCNVSLAAAPMPTGATATFAPTSLSGAGGQSPSSTLTIHTTNSGVPAGRTPPGTYPFTVTVTRVSGCQGSGSISTSGTLNVFGTPTKVGFVQQPTSTTGGAPITPAVTVAVLDGNNNVVANSNAAITLVIGTNPGGGTLSGTVSHNAVSGVATFSNLSIDKLGTGYTLTGASSGLTGATSSAFNITLGPAAVVRVETAANGSGTVVPVQTVPSGNSVTVFSIRRDAGGNFVDNVAADAWSLVNLTGSVVPGDLSPAGNKKSATFTGNAAGSAAIRTTLAGVSSVDSGTLTVISSTVNTTTSVSSSQNPSSFGQAVTFSATVAPSTGVTAPTGSVQFVVDGSNFGGAITLSPSGSNGVATSATVAALTASGSPHTVAAQYTPTGSFNASTGTLAGGQIVAQATSVTTVTCAAGPFTYASSAQTPCTASYTTSDGLSGNLTVSYSNNTNAGTASASATYPGDANHAPSTDLKNFTIDRATSVTMVICPATIAYTGSPLTPCTAAVTGAGGLNQVLTVSYTNNTIAGTANATASFGGDANHTASSDSKSFTIDKAATATVITCPVGPYVYTGAPQTPCSATATGPGGLSVSVTVTYGNNTAAGTATADATYAGDADHDGSTATQATFTIGKAVSATAITCPASVTYDGTAQTPCSATATGAGGLSASVTASYGNNTQAGTATADATYPGDANHDGSTASQATFTIAKAASATTITCPPSVTYDGTAQTPCSAMATGAGGLSVSVTVSYGNNTQAGTATADATYAGDANHDGSTASQATFTIAKAASTTVISCSAGPYVYTGTAQMPCTAAVTGAGGLNQVLTVSYTNNTNAGTANATASFAGDENHTASNDAKNFTIDKATSTTSVTCPTSVIYTGSALTPCTASVTGAGGLNQVLTESYTNNTNAGTANASASFAGDENHTASSDAKSFTIDKATSATMLTCPTSVTTPGAPLTPCSATATGAGNLSVSATVTYGNNINAGTATRGLSVRRRAPITSGEHGPRRPSRRPRPASTDRDRLPGGTLMSTRAPRRHRARRRRRASAASACR